MQKIDIASPYQTENGRLLKKDNSVHLVPVPEWNLMVEKILLLFQNPKDEKETRKEGTPFVKIPMKIYLNDPVFFNSSPCEIAISNELVASKKNQPY